MRCPHCGRRISRIRRFIDRLENTSRAGARQEQADLSDHSGSGRAPAPTPGKARDETSGLVWRPPGRAFPGIPTRIP